MPLWLPLLMWTIAFSQVAKAPIKRKAVPRTRQVKSSDLDPFDYVGVTMLLALTWTPARLSQIMLAQINQPLRLQLSCAGRIQSAPVQFAKVSTFRPSLLLVLSCEGKKKPARPP